MASPAQPLLNIKDKLQRGSQDVMGGNWKDLVALMLGHSPVPMVGTVDPTYTEQQRQNATHSFGMKYGQNDRTPMKASRNLAGVK